MFERIMFATTGSPSCDHAAHVAFDLAKKYNSKLWVFHALGIPTRGNSPFVVDVRTGQEIQYSKDYEEWVREEMKNTYAKQLADTKDCVIETVVGVAHTEILRKAHKENVDLIVMGAHTRQDEEAGAARFRSIVGSTMQQVAKRARCPVLIVSRPCTTCFWYFSNIVLCVDFSKASYAAFLFAQKVAKEIGCKIHLFHSVDLSSAAGKTPDQFEIEEKLRIAREKMKETYASAMNYDNFGMEVWEGIPYVEILKFARERNADLIIMAHHTKEVDPEKALLGSTVEQVVLRSTCPVASVNRPDMLEAPKTP